MAYHTRPRRRSSFSLSPPALSHRGVVLVAANAVANMGIVMAKLTDTQLILRTTAAQRDEGNAGFAITRATDKKVGSLYRIFRERTQAAA